jgi:hypothetical protein
MCPDAHAVEAIRARYVEVGREHIYFDLVRSVEYFPFDEDVNQNL